MKKFAALLTAAALSATVLAAQAEKEAATATAAVEAQTEQASAPATFEEVVENATASAASDVAASAAQ